MSQLIPRHHRMSTRLQSIQSHLSGSSSLQVGVLGATGTVGQRFITLLSRHPYLKIHSLGASARSAGKPYIKATKWKQTTPCADAVRQIVIKPCSPEHFAGCDIIFSGLDSDVAGEIEAAFRKAGFRIFSNARNYRRDLLVPLVVPTANPSHIDMIPVQQRETGSGKGFIVTNSNCSTSGLVVPLAALQKTWPDALFDVSVVTMQAISGGGYPGVPSLDILDNVVPHISGEEEKMEWESLKILGGYRQGALQVDMKRGMTVSASCNRVAVLDGHLMCVSLRFAADRPAPRTLDEVRQCWESYMPLAEVEKETGVVMPSAPKRAIFVHEEDDRPQPRLDRELDNGYAVSVGRLRPLCSADDTLKGIRFVALVHNTVLGAAGMGILNAELAVARGYI